MPSVVPTALRTDPVLRAAPAQTEDLLQEVEEDDSGGVLASAGDKAAQVSSCRTHNMAHSCLGLRRAQRLNCAHGDTKPLSVNS